MKRVSRLLAVMLVVLMAALPLFACSDETAPDESGFPSPDPSGSAFVPVLAPTAGAEAATILAPSYQRADYFDKVVERLNAMLKDRGVNVKFVLKADSNPGSENSTYAQAVNKALAAKEPEADAFLINSSLAAAFKENEALMNVLPLLKTAAPLYYERHKAEFDKGLFGIPVGMNSYSYRVQPAFMLREDVERDLTPKVSTLEELMAFIDNDIVAAKRNWSVLADPVMLVELWSYERGYYPMGGVYSDGFFFARADDPECKPELLERIPGFYDLMDKLVQLYMQKVLVYPSNPDSKREAVGIIRNLGDYALQDYGNNYSWVSGTFTAHVFYENLPSFYIEQSGYNGMLLMSEGCTKANDIMMFVEWLYSSQDNYNTVLFGEPGTDYTVNNGRLTVLLNGKAVAMPVDSKEKITFNLWPGAQFLFSTDYNMLPQNAPSNYEKLIDNGKSGQSRLPFEEYIARASEENKRLLTPTADMRPVMDHRNDSIYSIVYSMFRGGYAPYKASLDTLKNDWVLGEYANLVKKFIDAVKKQG